MLNYLVLKGVFQICSYEKDPHFKKKIMKGRKNIGQDMYEPCKKAELFIQI